jgi:hypothetical protein
MERPQSIVNFERAYLGSVVLGLVSTAVNWDGLKAQVAATPGAEILPEWFLPASIGASIVINLLLWFFVAKRGSAVAKWIVVALFAFSLFSLPRLFGGDVALPGTLLAFAVVNYLLNAVAVWMLFRPDTKSWFGETRGTGGGDNGVARTVED